MLTQDFEILLANALKGEAKALKEWQDIYYHSEKFGFTDKQVNLAHQTLDSLLKQTPQYPYALFLKGTLFERDEDDVEAINFYDQAMLQKNIEAKLNRADLYTRGRGSNVNHKAAIKLYDEAIESSKNPVAKYRRALYHVDGRGSDGVKNYPEAIKLLEGAWQQFHPSEPERETYYSALNLFKKINKAHTMVKNYEAERRPQPHSVEMALSEMERIINSLEGHIKQIMPLKSEKYFEDGCYCAELLLKHLNYEKQEYKAALEGTPTPQQIQTAEEEFKKNCKREFDNSKFTLETYFGWGSYIETQANALASIVIKPENKAVDASKKPTSSKIISQDDADETSETQAYETLLDTALQGDAQALKQWRLKLHRGRRRGFTDEQRTLAHEILDTLLENNPEHSYALFLKGTLLEKAEEYNAAIQYYHQAMHQENVDAFLRRAMLYRFGIGSAVNYDAAIELYDKAIVEFDNIDAMRERAELYIEDRGGEGIKNYPKAIELINRICNKLPPHTPEWENYKTQLELYSKGIELHNRVKNYEPEPITQPLTVEVTLSEMERIFHSLKKELMLLKSDEYFKMKGARLTAELLLNHLNYYMQRYKTTLKGNPTPEQILTSGEEFNENCELEFSKAIPKLEKFFGWGKYLEMQSKALSSVVFKPEIKTVDDPSEEQTTAELTESKRKESEQTDKLPTIVKETAIIQPIPVDTLDNNPKELSAEDQSNKMPVSTGTKRKGTEQQYEALVGKLLVLTKDYLAHLQDEKDIRTFEDAVLNEKHSAVEDLVNCLENKVLRPSSFDRVAKFYETLNQNEKLSTHRDSSWKRFIKNALIVGGILITGLLPGLAFLLIYRNTGHTAGKSLQFWKSQGDNFSGKAKNLELQKVEDELEVNQVESKLNPK